MTLAGGQPYDIVISTSGNDGAETKAPIYIVLIGTEG